MGQDLVIITGQGVAGPGRAGEGFVLTDELQRLLIDEYLPPIPSSTEPNNPGRLRVRAEHIYASPPPPSPLPPLPQAQAQGQGQGQGQAQERDQADVVLGKGGRGRGTVKPSTPKR